MKVQHLFLTKHFLTDGLLKVDFVLGQTSYYVRRGSSTGLKILPQDACYDGGTAPLFDQTFSDRRSPQIRLTNLPDILVGISLLCCIILVLIFPIYTSAMGLVRRNCCSWAHGMLMARTPNSERRSFEPNPTRAPIKAQYLFLAKPFPADGAPQIDE